MGQEDGVHDGGHAGGQGEAPLGHKADQEEVEADVGGGPENAAEDRRFHVVHRKVGLDQQVVDGDEGQPDGVVEEGGPGQGGGGFAEGAALVHDLDEYVAVEHRPQGKGDADDDDDIDPRRDGAVEALHVAPGDRLGQPGINDRCDHGDRQCRDQRDQQMAVVEGRHAPLRQGGRQHLVYEGVDLADGTAEKDREGQEHDLLGGGPDVAGGSEGEARFVGKPGGGHGIERATDEPAEGQQVMGGVGAEDDEEDDAAALEIPGGDGPQKTSLVLLVGVEEAGDAGEDHKGKGNLDIEGRQRGRFPFEAGGEDPHDEIGKKDPDRSRDEGDGSGQGDGLAGEAVALRDPLLFNDPG